jgi:hypothetical protein
MSTRLGWIACAFGAVVVAVLAALVSSRSVVQPAAPAELCWRSLGPDAGDQYLELAMTNPALASAGPGEAWLSWQEDDPRILKWVKRNWTPVPTQVGADALWHPVVASSPSGSVIVAVTSGRDRLSGTWDPTMPDSDDGRLALRIARATEGSWKWLGEPLISTRKPFTHVHEVSIAFVDGERPVIAWSEERDAELAGLFVAVWDGSSWTRLGALTPGEGDFFHSPAVAVDVNKQVWLGWTEGRLGGVRVARWDGSAWLDVGRDALEKLAAAQGWTLLPELSLAVDTKGHAWVLRRVGREQPFGVALALARWDGVSWTAVPAPRGPEGKDWTARSATMILRDDAPIVAWSQADASDNHYLFVSEWTAGDRWTARLSGLHVVEGVSNVDDVRLAAGDAQSFFVSWDEPGKDKRRTRLVQAYSCATGEVPAAPPKSVVERDTWPTTVDEAARRIAGALDAESKARVRAMKKDQLIKEIDTFFWGMGIRNSLGLLRGNTKLLESCGHGRRADPDECSGIIIEAVWTLLQVPSIPSARTEPPRR